MVETLSFQADISELLNLIIHAFYSNRDVFLREVISNASDALDKQRFYDLQEKKLDEVYRIRIAPDKEKNVLVIEDTGIGMSNDDLIQHLSTIAKSGTKQFVRTLQEKSEQIGQFGVGFYSVFLVAEKVNVYTQKAGDKVYKWSSTAQDYYTIEEDEATTFETGHGTRIELFLKEDAKDYVEEGTIRKIVTTHSSFITHPIELLATKSREIKEEEEEGDGQIEEIEEDDGGEPVDGETVTLEETVPLDTDPDTSTSTSSTPVVKTEEYQEWEQINGNKSIWSLAPSDVAPEDYQTLYKTISHNYDEALFYRHFRTEGAYEFRGVLFIPSQAPFDMLGERQREKRRIRLYVKNVLVLNELEKEMLPDWMSFVVGVIDSQDLPLNVSREMLQQTKVLQAMKTQLKKQILNMLTSLFEDEPDKYKTFYQNFHRNIKLGIHEGDESLLKFLKIESSGEASGTTDLETYASKMKEGQKEIFYITGQDPEIQPITKLYVEHGYEVLFFKEPIDEFMLQRIQKFKEFDLVNVCKDHKVPWGVSTAQDEETSTAFCSWVQTQLGDASVEQVRFSETLLRPSDVPCLILSSKFGWTGNMEKIMMAQPLSDAKSMGWMKGKKIWELNRNHPFIQRFLEYYKETISIDDPSADTETEQQPDEAEGDTTRTAVASPSIAVDPVIQGKISLLYESALLSAGYPISKSSEFVERVLKCISV